MISKKKLLARIELLETRLTQLENMHANVCEPWDTPFSVSLGDALYELKHKYRGKVANYGTRRLTSDEIRDTPQHPRLAPETASTKEVRDVTLNELASYVLDKKPILRKQNKTIQYTVEHAPDTTTRSVSTDLGNITVTEGK